MFRAACPMPQVRCPDGQTFFARVNTTGQSKERNGSSVTLGGGSPPYSLCLGQHNRPRQRKERVQRHAGRTAILRCRAGQLNESRLELLGFTIPPAWPCHAVPPLHKGGFFFAQANTTGPSSHNPHGCSVALGPYRAPPGARKRSGVRWPDGQAVLPHQIAQQSQTQKSSPEQQESFFFWLGCLTGCGSTACQWRLATGSAVWVQRHAAHQISGLASAGRALG